MADSYRRLLKRPAGVGGSDWSRLGRLLADAVRRQRQFADQSPHVLRFIGELTEHDQDTYFVEHEPASPMPLGGLFNPSAPAVHQSQLLRVTVALFDALRPAHNCQEPRPIAHGGVCPGVVLFTPDGKAKLTDFGFAGAVCEVLGTDSYVNLAVGPPESDSGDVHLTGAWEVLAPDRFDRDDRICAFIDPEKYGTHALGAFEPGSDVIAAGFVLHLLAEHQHPYLHADPDAHRLVEMSEYMAMGRYNQARRQDLRESTDPGVRLWCDLIARTLARLPQNRPTAGAVADALAQHVKPEDAADNLRRQLDALQGLADGQAWDELSEAARTIAASRGAPPDVVERANALTVVAQANLLLAQARETLAGSDWPAAREPADQVLAMPGLPADLAHQAREVADSVEANLAAQAVLSQVKSRLEQDDGSDPIATVELMQALLAELDRIAADRPLLPPLRLLQATVRNTVADALEAARPAAESAKDADRARADQWLVQLDSALADERWDDLEQGLADRPQLRSWPEEAAARAQAVQQALDDHRAGEKRQAAIEADRQAAQGWIERLRQATEAQEWTAAEQVLGDKPRLTHWPQEVLDEANRLAARLRAVARKEADEEQARQWCAKLKQAVQAEDWDAGADLLAQRPALDYWPQDALDSVAPYQKEVEQRVAAVELERRRAEQEARQAGTWFEQANQAGKDQQWEQALEILAAPPPVENIPEQLLEHAEKLRRFCRARLGEAIVEQLQARSRAVRELARAFVRELVAARFQRLAKPDSIEVLLDADEFVCDHPNGDGRALLRVRPRTGAAEACGPGIACPFDFRISDEPKDVLDDDGTLHTRVAGGLTDLLAKCQEMSLGRLEATLGEGLFPKAEVTARLTEPTDHIVAKIELLGPEAGQGSLETELTWDDGDLTWVYADPVEFVERALQVCIRIVTDDISERLLAGSDELRRYEPMVSFELARPTPANPRTLPGQLGLNAELVIPPGSPAEPQTLQTFSVTCANVESIDCDVDLTPAVARLRQVVTAAQRSDRAAIESDVQARLKAAGARVKLAVLPKRIDQPIDRITLTLTPKGREPLELTADWDVEKFGFALPDGWQRRAAEVLGSPPGAGRAAQPPGGGRRRAIAALAAVAVVAVAAGTWTFWPQGPPPTPVTDTTPADSVGQPRPEQPASANQNAEGTQPVTPGTTPPVSENTSEAPGQPAGDNDNVEGTVRQELLAWFGELDDRFGELKTQLDAPSHDRLLGMIRDRSVDSLGQELDDLADELPEDETDLRAQVRDRQEQLDDWQEKLSTYEKIIDLGGKNLSDQIELLEDVGGAWATEYVTNLLGKLRVIQQPFDLAEREQAKGNWRAALFFLDRADEAAQNAGLLDHFSRPRDALMRTLTDARREVLTDVLAEADELLVSAGRPPEEPLEHMAHEDYAIKARSKLDQLDLDYPTGARPGQWVQKAEEQNLFPWTILTDDQKRTVEELLAWVNLTLPIGSAEGAGESAIDFAFIGAASAWAIQDPIWMSQTEITVDQYRTLMGDLPARAGPRESYEAMRSDGGHPIAFVPANQAHSFCLALMQQFEGRLSARVPLAGEWKYALQVGGAKPLQANPQLCKYDAAGVPGWNPERMNFDSDEFDDHLFAPGHCDGHGRYAPVRSYPPNRWGLYDMCGNVREWVGSAGSKLETLGGSFRDRWVDDHTEPGRPDQVRPHDDVGLRIVVLLQS